MKAFRIMLYRKDIVGAFGICLCAIWHKEPGSWRKIQQVNETDIFLLLGEKQTIFTPFSCH